MTLKESYRRVFMKNSIVQRMDGDEFERLWRSVTSSHPTNMDIERKYYVREYRRYGK